MTHESDTPPRRDWRENARFAANIVNSLAIPLLTVAATIVGLYATNTLKEREIAIATENNSQSLRNQREESETNLRSAMFRELVGPLLQSETEQLKAGGDTDLPRSQRLALLAELLALNFHEHFELGPLLRYVDTLPGQTEEARARLRSTSRRVISRQLAPLLSTAAAKDGRHPSFLEISLNSDGTEAAETLLSCAVPAAANSASGSHTLNCSSTAQGSPLRIVSPDGKDNLQVNVRAVSWAAQTVGIYAVLLDANGAHAADRVHAVALLVPVLRQHAAAGRQPVRHLPDAHRRHPGRRAHHAVVLRLVPQGLRAPARTAVRSRRARAGAGRHGAGAQGPRIAVDLDNEPDRPLRDDIRLLGRLLGDTVRDQEGSPSYDVVERVRQSAIAFHRDANVGARRELERILDGLSREQTMIVARAFSYFSHLANLAEDLHNSRRKRQADINGEPPSDGSLARALDRIEATRMPLESLAGFFREGVVVPVLTAHPTEVQRKSVRDLEMQIERLLQARERTRLTPQEQAANDESIRGAVLALWQTRMLRLEKLDVLDEVANGLSFFEQTFLPEVPLLYGALEDELQRRYPDASLGDLPSFLRIGSWIGGDRDGNPFVTADVLERTLRMQSSRVFEYYLEQLHTLGAELSMTTLVTAVSAELNALADRSPDKSPHRRDEPYRRALTGLYARVAATARALDMHEPLRHAIGAAPPYTRVAEFAADLEIIRRSLEAHDSALLARGRLRRLRRAVDVFGFHLAAVDLRQNSDVHQRVVTELFEPCSAQGRMHSAANSRSCRPRRRCTSATARRASPTT